MEIKEGIIFLTVTKVIVRRQLINPKHYMLAFCNSNP